LVAAEVAVSRATAVLIPTTSPRAFTSGPPELPDEIAASVWIRPSRNAPSVPMVRSSADTMPSVTDGSPSRPSAKPIATTSSPMRTLPGSANTAASKPSPLIRSSARSLPGSAGEQTCLTRLGLAGQTHADLGGALDDVGVGEDLAVGRDDHPGAGRLAPTERLSMSALIVTTEAPCDR
jgi:hypothetical protein